MNVLVFVISLVLTAHTKAVARKIPPDTSSGQQCIFCKGENCHKQSPAVTYCSQKCATMVNLGSGDKPNYDKPYIEKGCSDAIWFHRVGGCENKCYDEKEDFGDTKNWMCLYCCTGDKCNELTPGVNAGSQIIGGIISKTMSVALSLTVVHARLY